LPPEEPVLLEVVEEEIKQRKNQQLTSEEAEVESKCILGMFICIAWYLMLY